MNTTPVAKTKPPGGIRLSIFIGAAILAIALAYVGWRFWGFERSSENESGTLIVKVTGNDYSTPVTGPRFTVKNNETKRTFTIDLHSQEVSTSLEPGSYSVLNTDSGLTALTQRFNIRSAKPQIVEVLWKPKTAGDAKSKASSVAASKSPDRVAAEWIQSISSHPHSFIVVKENGDEQHLSNEYLKSVTALPEEPFELTAVRLHDDRDLTEHGLENLKGCRSLNYVHLGNTGTSDKGLAYFKACSPYLRELHLPNGVTDAGLANFKECRELTRLSLLGVRASTEGLENFRQCKKLTSLFLGGADLAGVSLASFAGCSNLEVLDIRDSGLDPAELVHFQDCRKLRKLDLSGNPAITNKELAYFQNCEELTLLNITFANINDEALSFLHGCEDLAFLGIGETSVSDAFIDALRARLPNCNIVSTAAPMKRLLHEEGGRPDVRGYQARAQADVIMYNVNRRVAGGEFGAPADQAKVRKAIQLETDRRKRVMLLPKDVILQWKLDEHGKVTGCRIRFQSGRPN